MTLVAAWIDWSNNREERLLCLADSRISNTVTPSPITDHSTKLFKLPIALHHIDDFDPFSGTLRSPYHQTSVALGYSGDLVLASTIVSILSQTFSNLTTLDNNRPKLAWGHLCSHVEATLRAVSRSYAAIKPMTSRFLVFGFFEDRYQLVRFTHSEDNTFSIEPVDLYQERWVSIGTGSIAFDNKAGKALRPLRLGLTVAQKRFERARNRATKEDCEVEMWRARAAFSSSLRNEFQRQVSAGGIASVGGTVQVLEVRPGFIAIRKIGDASVLGVPGIELIGPFQALFVQEAL